MIDIPRPIRQFINGSKRMAYRAGLAIRTKIGETSQSLANFCLREEAVSARPYYKTSDSDFSRHPLYLAIGKHLKIAELFNFSNPFYRIHDHRKGAATYIDGRRYTNFASYDYLGLNDHPSVTAAAKEAIDAYGTSVSASRIVAGERPIHRQLEEALATFYGVQSAITFVSGHATNVSTIGTLMSSGDLIVYDELVHNSMIVGAKLSGAEMRPFRHNDMASLEQILSEAQNKHPHVLILVEGLYSMDGDVAHLPRLVELKKKYGTWLMVDEAHALGVLGMQGRGTAEHFSIDTRDVDIWMGTLSKTLASCGGYIAGRQELIDILKYKAPGLVYSVGLSPPLASAAFVALGLIKTEAERVSRLQANGRLFLQLARKAGLKTGTSDGYAIVSVIVGDILVAGLLSDRLMARGLNVLPIIFPAVPLKSSRFRFFITSEHTSEQIHNTVCILQEELSSSAMRKAA